jgi:hypothetical protein
VDGPVKPGHDGVDESKPASFGIIPISLGSDSSRRRLSKSKAWMAVSSTAMTEWVDRSLAMMVGVNAKRDGLLHFVRNDEGSLS